MQNQDSIVLQILLNQNHHNIFTSNNKITEKMQDIYLNFNFAKPESAIKNLFLDDDLSK